MTYLLFFAIIALGLALMVSSTRWRLSKDRVSKLDLSSFAVYESKAVSASAQLKAGQTLAIPMNCNVFINEQEIHIIPNKFKLFLFMTDFPFSFYRKQNKKITIQRSEYTEIKFEASKRDASLFGKVFEVTIIVHNQEEKTEILRKIKKWR